MTPLDGDTPTHPQRDSIRISAHDDNTIHQKHSLQALGDYEQPVRHPDFSFDDGNIAIATGRYYFLVHQGLLSHHSKIFADFAQALDGGCVKILESRPVMDLNDSPDDILHFLRALYEGISTLRYDAYGFSQVSSILLMATKYCAFRLQSAVIEQLSVGWPTTLNKWEERERMATDGNGLYAPRPTFPHPIPIINLARATNVPKLLPSALYDLSRYLPSQLVSGYTSHDSTHYKLSNDDILATLKGRESAARFLSTFTVAVLEGRDPSIWCAHRLEESDDKRKICRMAFEAITFELLRDVNGLICNRNSDPLYAIAECHAMQTHNDVHAAHNGLVRRACEACRLELASVVKSSREEFWMKLPGWFDVEVPEWGE